jgi:hypothetical protein
MITSRLTRDGADSDGFFVWRRRESMSSDKVASVNVGAAARRAVMLDLDRSNPMTSATAGVLIILVAAISCTG